MAVIESDVCDHCGSTVNTYERKITSNMAQTLIDMYNNSKWGYSHTPSLEHNSNPAQLRWWGLIKPKSGRRKNGTKNGYWKLTPFGVRFVEGKTTVQKNAIERQGKVLRLSGPEVTIQDCLGDNFDLNELLSR